MGEGVSLKGAPLDPYRGRVAVRCDELSGGTALEVGFEAGEILREAEKLQDAD